ncbi:MAG: discoidin domain-containing protein, partial [Kiritimatiellae bacterium]|nr:discoidin domain-containing protein [Kiritimatiellia bacterium]
MKNMICTCLAAGTVWACAAAPVNVALHKPYKLSPAPRYRHCTDPGDKTQLTDGDHSQGYFWTQKGTVGWNNVAPVLCTIDLGKVEPVCGVSWSTAAGVAGVTWPQSLLVMVSDDGRRWTFIGDLCDSGSVDKKPPEGKYATFRFASERMKGRGRYVCVIAAARPFCFVDEIEVWRGPDAWLGEPVEGPQSDDPRRFYMESRARSGVAARLRDDLATIIGQAEERGLAAALAESRARADELRAAIGDAAAQAADTFRTVLPYGETHEAILALNAPVLRAAGVTRPLVRPAGRWDPLDLTAQPKAGQKTAGPVTLDLMRGEVRGAAVNITNPFDEPLTFTVRTVGMPAALNLELREALATDTQSRT